MRSFAIETDRPFKYKSLVKALMRNFLYFTVLQFQFSLSLAVFLFSTCMASNSAMHLDLLLQYVILWIDSTRKSFENMQFVKFIGKFIVFFFYENRKCFQYASLWKSYTAIFFTEFAFKKCSVSCNLSLKCPTEHNNLIRKHNKCGKATLN